MVRLLPRKALQLKSQIEVSIPQWCDCCAEVESEEERRVAGFNPTMVRLLLCHWRRPRSRWLCFNPTMVRLLLEVEVEGRRYVVFQSHNGAIAAAITLPIFTLTQTFQSHNGAIAASILML